MEITPTRLLVSCGLMFAGIVAIAMVAQNETNNSIKMSLSKLDLTDLKQRLQREEGIPAVEPEEVTED